MRQKVSLSLKVGSVVLRGAVLQAGLGASRWRSPTALAITS